MREKPYTAIESVEPELIDAVVQQHGGPPDNFVESAEATIVGLPNLDTDPDARLVIEGLEARASAMIAENRNGISSDANTAASTQANPSHQSEQGSGGQSSPQSS